MHDHNNVDESSYRFPSRISLPFIPASIRWTSSCYVSVGIRRNYEGALMFKILLCLWLDSYLASVVWVCISWCVSGEFLCGWLAFINLHILPVCCNNNNNKNTIIWENLPIRFECVGMPGNHCCPKTAVRRVQGWNLLLYLKTNVVVWSAATIQLEKRFIQEVKNGHQGSMSHTSPTPLPARVCFVSLPCCQRSNRALSWLDLCFSPLIRACSSPPL